MNPNALVFWAILAISGYLIWGTLTAALVGLLIGLILSSIAELL